MIPHFIVVEGFDGCGKSTLGTWIAERYGYEYRKSPGGNFAKARHFFDSEEVSIEERFSFYMADNIFASIYAQNFLSNNEYILFDRYFYSTIVYHEILSTGISQRFENIVKCFQIPDLIIYLDVNYDVILSRLTQKDKSTNDNLFLSKEKYERICKMYESVFNARYAIIDNNGSLESTRHQLIRLLN
jgi:thymidylate kinase